MIKNQPKLTTNFMKQIVNSFLPSHHTGICMNKLEKYILWSDLKYTSYTMKSQKRDTEQQGMILFWLKKQRNIFSKYICEN